MIQGFPENFILPESRSRWMKLIGNSVSVPVIDALCKAIIKTSVFSQPSVPLRTDVKELEETVGRLLKDIRDLKRDHDNNDKKLDELSDRAEEHDKKLNDWTENHDTKLGELSDWTQWELRRVYEKDDTGKIPNSRLLNPKETTIQLLEETASQAGFVRWVEELYMHLENIG